MSMRVADLAAGTIDYRLNLLGLRISAAGCQLVAKSGDDWSTIGPPRELPVQIPRTVEELQAAVNDTLRLMASQYEAECPGSDLPDVMSQRRPLAAALRHEQGTAGSP